MKVKVTHEINDGKTRLKPDQYVEVDDRLGRDWVAFGLAVDASEVAEENLGRAIEPEFPVTESTSEEPVVEVGLPEEIEPEQTKAPAKKVAAKKAAASGRPSK